MDQLKNHQLSIYNSLSGEKEAFEALDTPNVGMYVCGPTVYSYLHLGNCRTFLTFDMVYRYLTYLGYKLRYVRNITDAGHLTDDGDVNNDRFVKQSRLEKLEPMEIVQKYTVYFHEVMQQFNAIPPSIEPTATGHILEQIEMAQTLIEKGLAYEINGSVYFDTMKYHTSDDYGKLSGRDIENLIEGTRDLDGQGEKRDPRDFALWKSATPAHIMRWNSPWGEGFPGWHIECSVMSSKYLGNQFDIHGGGMDLKFPHHECEIAQCKGVHGVDPVKYWMHGNMLTLNGKRMSKSTGNTILPHELFSGTKLDVIDKAYDPMVVRFFMMQAHYRSTLDFSSEALSASEKGYQKLMEALKTLNTLTVTQEDEAETTTINKLIDACYAFMDDDFNTPRTIATLFELVTKINTYNAANGAPINTETLERLKLEFNGFIIDVLGLKTPQADNSETLDGVINMVIDIRQQAKKDKNFALADQIREDLKEAGVSLRDSREGTTYTLN